MILITPPPSVCVCSFRTWTLTFCPPSPGALQIENSEESDQGKYECVAVNSAGTRYSAPANLYVRGKTPLDPPVSRRRPGRRLQHQGPLLSSLVHAGAASWLLIGARILPRWKWNLLMPVIPPPPLLSRLYLLGADLCIYLGRFLTWLTSPCLMKGRLAIWGKGQFYV